MAAQQTIEVSHFNFNQFLSLCLTLLSLTTVQREYASLVSLPYFDLFNTIMRPRMPEIPKLDQKDIRETMTTYSVNEPQAKAILSTLRSEGFVLIQGYVVFTIYP